MCSEAAAGVQRGPVFQSWHQKLIKVGLMQMM